MKKLLLIILTAFLGLTVAHGQTGKWGWQDKEDKASMKKNKVKSMTIYSANTSPTGNGIDSLKTGTRKYDRNGNLIENIEYVRNFKGIVTDTDKVVFKYDSLNNIVYKKTSSSSDTSSIIETYQNFYDNNGNLIEQIHITSNGEKPWTKFTYDKQGRVLTMKNGYYTFTFEYKDKYLIKEIQASPGYSKTITYEYSADYSQMTKTEPDWSGTLKPITTVYKFDINGKTIYEKLLDYPYSTYTYSRKGLLIFNTHFTDNKQNGRYTYTYEFY